MKVARIAASSMIGILIASRFIALYEILQAVQFAFAQNLRLHHPADQFLHGAAAEAVDNLAHGAGSHGGRGFGRQVNVGPPLLLVAKISLLFEPPQDRPDTGLLHFVFARNDLMYTFNRTTALVPDSLHDVSFQGRQWWPQVAA